MIFIYYFILFIAKIGTFNTVHLCSEILDVNEMKGFEFIEITSLEISSMNNFFASNAHCNATIIKHEFNSKNLELEYIIPKSIDLADGIIKYTIFPQNIKIISFLCPAPIYEDIDSGECKKEYHEGKVKVLIEKGFKWMNDFFKKEKRLLNRFKNILCLNETTIKFGNSNLYKEIYNQISNVHIDDLKSIKKIFLSNLENQNETDTSKLFDLVEDFINYIKKSINDNEDILNHKLSKSMNNCIKIEPVIFIDKKFILDEPKLIFLDTRDETTQIFNLVKNFNGNIIIKRLDFSFEIFHKVKYISKIETKEISKDITSLFHQLKSYK